MRKVCLCLLLLCATLNGAATARLFPGSWGLCQLPAPFDNVPMTSPYVETCGAWFAAGKPITYNLLISSSAGAEVVAVAWQVTATLDGVFVTSSGVVSRVPGEATVVSLSFGGKVRDTVITITELAPVSVSSHAERSR